jgi:hypothetical protein
MKDTACSRRSLAAILGMPVLVACTAAFSACNGSVQASVADGGLNRDGTVDGTASRRDATVDAESDSSSDAPDAGLLKTMDADAYAYPRPSADARVFDGCAPDRCAAGQVCVSFSEMGGASFGRCNGPPMTCDQDVTCLCVVEAAEWCEQPTCTDYGGAVTLNCLFPPHP